MNLRDKGPVILASVKKKAPAVVDWPTVEKLARAGHRPRRGAGGTRPRREAAATRARREAATRTRRRARPRPTRSPRRPRFSRSLSRGSSRRRGATFPPDHVRQPETRPRGRRSRRCSCATTPGSTRPRRRSRRRPAGDWRAYDGGGQYENMPFLGAAGAPFSLCVKSHRVVKGVGEAPVSARGGDAPARATRGQSVRDAPERRQRRLARVRDARGERARAGRRRPREGARAEKREVVVPRPAGACCASARFFAHTPLGFNVRSRRLSTDR